MRFDATTGTVLQLDAEALRDIGREVRLEADDLARWVEVTERPVVRLRSHDERALLLDVREHVGVRNAHPASRAPCVAAMNQLLRMFSSVMRFGIDAGTRWPPGRPAQLCMMAQASRFPFYIDDGASRRRPAMRARGLSSEARVPGPSDRLASTSLISVNAWSKIVIARSISSRVTVNGGAIRHTDPRSGRRRMFMLSPSCRHRSVERTQRVVRLARLAVANELDPAQESMPRTSPISS